VPLMCYRIRTDSVSAQSVRMSRHTWRIIRGQPDTSLLGAAACYVGYAARAFVKHAICAPRYPLDRFPDSGPGRFLSELSRTKAPEMVPSPHPVEAVHSQSATVRAIGVGNSDD